jgi:RecB family endonuclease NucS
MKANWMRKRDVQAPYLSPGFSDFWMCGARNSVLIVVGCCCVEYSGRARSTLGWGERIVIVKPDGSVLVHQRAGREPVNWQPPGTRVRYQTETNDNTPLL